MTKGVIMKDNIDSLPEGISRHRILSAAQSAALWGVSLPTWRRMYRASEVPPPIKLSARRLGWRAGDLIDALASRTVA